MKKNGTGSGGNRRGTDYGGDRHQRHTGHKAAHPGHHGRIANHPTGDQSLFGNGIKKAPFLQHLPQHTEKEPPHRRSGV